MELSPRLRSNPGVLFEGNFFKVGNEFEFLKALQPYHELLKDVPAYRAALRRYLQPLDLEYIMKALNDGRLKLTRADALAVIRPDALVELDGVYYTLLRKEDYHELIDTDALWDAYCAQLSEAERDEDDPEPFWSIRNALALLGLRY